MSKTVYGETYKFQGFHKGKAHFEIEGPTTTPQFLTKVQCEQLLANLKAKGVRYEGVQEALDEFARLSPSE